MDGGVLLVGCGKWGRNLARVLAQLGALTGISDPVEGLARAAAEEHGVAVRGLAEALQDPSIRAVVIAAPAAQHFALASEVIASGKHVFVEKPLALRSSDAERLVRDAEERGTVLMVGHLMRYHPAFRRLEDLVSEGALGRLRYIYSNRLNLGRFRREENILWSFAPHDISMILALVGSEPESVSAVGSAFLHTTIADVTTTHLAFASGERAHIFVSWLHPFKEQRLVVIGDAAMAVLEDSADAGAMLQLWPHHVDWVGGGPQPVRGEAVPVETPDTEPLRAELSHFLECCASGSAPITDGREGLRVLRVLEAAQASMSGGGQPRQTTASDSMVHETAYVDSPSEIGPGTRIWHFSHVLSGSRIGADCSIGQNVMIGPNVTIGRGCKIQNNVSVFEGVELEDSVFCGPSVVFTNVVNPRAEIARREEYVQTRVRKGATLGANCTVVCGHEVGEYAFVAAGAVVASDVPAYALFAGVPARRIGWMSRAGARLAEDLVCPLTGEKYRLVGSDRLEPVFA